MPFGNFTLHCKALWSATRLQTRKTRCQQKAATLKTIFRFQQLRFSFHWWRVLFSLLSRHSQKRPPFLDVSPKVPWPVGCLDGSGGYNTKKDEGTASFGWAWQFPILQRKAPVGWGLTFWSSMWFGFPRIHWTTPTPTTETRSSPSAKKKDQATTLQGFKSSDLGPTWYWSGFSKMIFSSKSCWLQFFYTQAQISESKIEVNVLTGFVISTSYSTEKTSQHFWWIAASHHQKKTPLDLKWPTCLKEIFKNLPQPQGPTSSKHPGGRIGMVQTPLKVNRIQSWSIAKNGIPVTSDEVANGHDSPRLGRPVSFLGDGFSILDIF